jgi:hypothetical protein
MDIVCRLCVPIKVRDLPEVDEEEGSGAGEEKKEEKKKNLLINAFS